MNLVPYSGIMECNGVTWAIDPAGHYSEHGVEAERLADACGIIPSFVGPEDVPLDEQLAINYNYHSGWKELGNTWEGEFHEDDLTYTYPEDPQQYPLAGVTLRDDTALVYPHGCVLVVKADGRRLWSRMD